MPLHVALTFQDEKQMEGGGGLAPQTIKDSLDENEFSPDFQLSFAIRDQYMGRQFQYSPQFPAYPWPQSSNQ